MKKIRSLFSRMKYRIEGMIPFSDRYKFRRIYPIIDSVEGLLVDNQEEWMFTTVKRIPGNANILEIGCYKGRSTVSFALACKGTRRRVFSIDTFGGVYEDVRQNPELKDIFRSGFLEEWRDNIFKSGVNDYAIPLQGRSGDIAKIWSAPIHLLFIDGSHKYEDVVADFENYFSYVVPGGIVALHDIDPNWPGVYKAWHEVIKYRLEDVSSCGTLCYGKKAK